MSHEHQPSRFFSQVWGNSLRYLGPKLWGKPLLKISHLQKFWTTQKALLERLTLALCRMMESCVVLDVHGSFNQCMINVIIRWGVRSLVLLRNEINKTFNCNSSNGKTFVWLKLMLAKFRKMAFSVRGRSFLTIFSVVLSLHENISKLKSPWQICSCNRLIVLMPHI